MTTLDRPLDARGQTAEAASLRLRLVASSFLMLFVELALIRWTAANNVHLALLSLSPALRFVAATAIAFGPIFVATLLFAPRFRESSSTTIAFGADLLGAIVGGSIEYVALITGYRSLLVVVAALSASRS